MLLPIVGYAHCPACPLRGVQLDAQNTSTKNLDAAKNAGFNFIRQGFYWDKVERVPGKYDWSYYDDLIAELDSRNMFAYFTIYAHGRGGGNMTLPGERKGGITKWISAAAERYKNNNVVWELWNEPNVDRFWPPKSNVDEYVRFANEACEMIREKDASAVVVAGALAQRSRDTYLKKIIEGQRKNCFSYISLHPYRGSAPSSLSKDLISLKGWINGEVNLINGEWGYPTQGQRSISEQEQGEYAAQMAVVTAAEGMKYSVWYTLVDRGSNPVDREDNFGLIKSNGDFKPAYSAVSKINLSLKYRRPIMRCEGGDWSQQAVVFESVKDKSKFIYFWASSKERGGDWRLYYNSADKKWRGLNVNARVQPSFIELKDGLDMAKKCRFEKVDV
ncbi:cellulase family glycosylhydrolase [[Pseudomonas] boreopolis]|uniref:cellulase family glycosylhydrolase n=1 Tax=Xanthomonas boreopolis TaxID=86183 RepID=UPI003D3E3289